jgi:hypothetical protein
MRVINYICKCQLRIILMKMMGKFNRFLLMDNSFLCRSLKDVNEFIVQIQNEIYELLRRKKQMDRNKEKELQQQHTQY